MHDRSAGTWQIYHAPAAPHQISGVTASLPTEPVQLRKRAARACLGPGLFAAISVPSYHLTCRNPSWTSARLQEDSTPDASSCRVRKPPFRISKAANGRAVTRAVRRQLDTIHFEVAFFLPCGHDAPSRRAEVSLSSAHLNWVAGAMSQVVPAIMP
jgi:hypothetical protein